MEGKNIRQEIQTTIRSYRDTPHVNTGESPNKLMFGGEFNGRLPARMSKQTVPKSVQQRNAEFKQKCKMYADTRRRTKVSNIGIGDKVLIEQDKVDGLSPRYRPEPFEVVAKKGSMVTVQKGETTLCRNTAKFKLLKYEGNEDSVDEWAAVFKEGGAKG